MLRLARRLPRPALRARTLCAAAPIDSETYHKIANLTIEGLQEVYENEADDDPALGMDVEYAVRSACVARHGLRSFF